MSAIRSVGNKSTELRFIELMRKSGVTGWRRKQSLPGRPDFVFRAARLTVFVDGDFWHGNPKTIRIPKTNPSFWQQKIDRNRARDKEVARQLAKKGWRVLRIWESSLRKRPTAQIKRLIRELKRNTVLSKQAN